MIRINQINTTSLKYLGKRFELATDLVIKVDDEIEIPRGNEHDKFKVTEIRDILTDDDRHHGDILNQHRYFITVKDI